MGSPSPLPRPLHPSVTCFYRAYSPPGGRGVAHQSTCHSTCDPLPSVCLLPPPSVPPATPAVCPRRPVWLYPAPARHRPAARRNGGREGRAGRDGGGSEKGGRAGEGGRGERRVRDCLGRTIDLQCRGGPHGLLMVAHGPSPCSLAIPEHDDGPRVLAAAGSIEYTFIFL